MTIVSTMKVEPVQLGQLLQRSTETVRLALDAEYSEVTVRLNGNGAKLRRKVRGAEIASESRYLARAGQLILSRIDARHGAVALLPDSLDGAVVTNDFPLFDFNIERVIPEYLSLVIKAEEFVELCKRASKGSTNRVRIKEDLFLAFAVPLPPLNEQRRIVAKVQEAMGALDRAAALHAQTVADFDRLLIALAHRDDLTEDQKRERGWRKLRLGDVMRLDLDPVKVDPSQDYPNLGIYSFAKGLFEKPPISGLATSAAVLNRVKSGQFIFSRLFAFEGSYGYVSADFDGFYVSGEYPTFTCDPIECRAEFVYAHFKPARIWQSLSAKSKGLGLRRQRVQPPAILAHEAWVPPMPEQDRIAEVLTAQRRFAASDSFQKDADALRRAVLSRAFRGEL